MLTPQLVKMMMARGQIWTTRDGNVYLVVSADPITTETGLVIAVRLVPGEFLPQDSAYIAHLPNGWAVIGTNLEVLVTSAFVAQKGEIEAQQLHEVEETLRSVMEL